MKQFWKVNSKIRLNLTFGKIKECFENKTLLFFYINNENSFGHNDEFILYLTNFDIKIINICNTLNVILLSKNFSLSIQWQKSFLKFNHNFSDKTTLK